jgi:hypothetical protein
VKALAAAALALGALALVLAEAARDPAAAAYAALAAASFGIATAWGALFVLMVGLASRASWVADLRRPLEAIVATLPAPTLALAVLLLFADQLYPWLEGGPALTPREEVVLQKTAAWRAPAFLAARSALYLVVPLALAEGLLVLSKRAERPGAARADARRSRLAVGGLVALFSLGSFAAFDWLMALEPGWVSTIYGAVWLTSGFATACGVLAVLVWAVRRRGGLARLPADPIHRLGKLLFASTVFWTYLAFAQYLIVWIGDVPAEIRYYLRRREGAWDAVGVALAVGGFALPFLALLPLAVKRHAGRLALVGAWVVGVHALEHAWLVLPARPDVGASWAVVPAFVAVVAAAVALGLARTRGVGRLPRRDPLSSRPASSAP